MLLSKMMGYFKMNTAKKINLLRHTVGKPLWQRNYYERIIRNEGELYAIRNYVRYNAQKWEEDDYYVNVD